MKYPALEVPLHTIQDSLLEKAQGVPEEASCGGAERVRSLSDLVWFKVKITNRRGIVTELPHEGHAQDDIVLSQSWWWVCAAGERKQDSPSDFYKLIEAEAVRAAKGADGRVSTTHLLPAEIDQKRLRAELALKTVLATRRLVRSLIAKSIRDGHAWTLEMEAHEITAMIRAEDGEAYLVVCAEGFLDPRVIAVILDAVPGVPSGDWLPEPGKVLHIQPRDGQIIYSTIIPPAAQEAILDELPNEA